MSDEMVRNEFKRFNDGRTKVLDSERRGQPTVVNDGLFEKMNEKIRENRSFISRLLCDEFPQRAVQQ
ncbi:hypothetical protein TNCV_2530631 [Trichonephila clavipes]|nr:hypothetical protein TNCV_2530631 [Trichonephila clavipes]